MQVVYCHQSCSSLEFPEVSESTVHAKENSTVSIRFHLNMNNCELIPDQWLILVLKETNGPPLNECSIRLKAGTCTLSDTSTACRCPSTDGDMLFSKRVTGSDEGVYVWRWSEKGSTTKEKMITLDVSAEELKTRERAAQDADAWEERPGMGGSTAVSLPHVEDLEAGAGKSVEPYIDNRVTFVVSITTCVCLVVITTVITAGFVICMKARRRHQLPSNPDLNLAFANLNGALLKLNLPRDQARDVYEEIPDPPKAHKTSRVSLTDNSRSRVQSLSVQVKEQEETTATPNPAKQVESCDSFDGYLHPAGVSSAQDEQKELAPVCVLSS